GECGIRILALECREVAADEPGRTVEGGVECDDGTGERGDNDAERHPPAEIAAGRGTCAFRWGGGRGHEAILGATLHRGRERPRALPSGGVDLVDARDPRRVTESAFVTLPEL